MGIVSHCPNGHRLKVKDHLAGKKGICPFCGARFRIPQASGTPAVTSQDQPPSGLPIADVVSLDSAHAASLPPALLQAGIGTAQGGSEIIMPAVIAEDSTASWCIAVPGGQPSAVMSGAALLKWLTSANVTGVELVWRSDWTDWRPVAQVFPDHVPPTFPQPGTAW